MQVQGPRLAIDVFRPFRPAMLSALTAIACFSPADAQQPPAAATAAQTSTAPASQSRVQIPIGAFVAQPFMVGPVLSPSGDRVVSRMAARNGSVLSILRLYEKPGTPRAMREAKFGDNNRNEIRDYRWITNDSLLVSLGARMLVYDVEKETSNYLPDTIDGAKVDRALYIDPEGGFILVRMIPGRARFPTVHRIDLATGLASEVVDGHAFISDWYVDAKGVVRFGVGYQGRKIKMVYRERDGEKFRTAAKFSWQDSDGVVDAIRFRHAEGPGYVLTNVKTGRFAVYQFDWKTFEIGAPVFEHPTVDVDSIVVDAEGSVDGVQYTDDRQRVAWLDPNMQQLQTEVDAKLPERVNRVVSRNRANKKFIIASFAANDTGRYYFFDRERGTINHLATPIDALKDKPLSPTEAVSYRSRDGLEIPAYLTLPLGVASKQLPLIVMPHGGPHVRDTWAYNPHVQFLANRGYAVLQPNFRGSSGYGKAYMERGFGQWGAAMQNDLADGVRWLTEQGIVDSKRICIMGASYGGYAALMGVIQSADLYRCAISFAGVTDIETTMKAPRSFLPPERYRSLLERFEGEGKIDFKTISPLRLAGKVGAPVFLAHGALDFTVRVSQGKAMAEELKKAGKQYEYLEFPYAAHGFILPEDHVRYLTAVETFLQKHNPANLPAAAQ